MKSPLRYHGGKSFLAPKIVALMAPHTRYVETHFGGGAVLFAKEFEGISEYVNDIDRELTDFWMVLRDTPQRMLHRLWATPLSRTMFDESFSNLQQDDRVLRATGFFIRNRQSRQGLGKDYCTPTGRTRRGMNEHCSAWLSAIDGLPEIHRRISRVEIRNQDALGLIRELDSPETLFYCDPSYMPETRQSVGQYRHEMTEEQHETLLHFLHRIKGKFLLSGYPSKLYDSFAAVAGWHKVEFKIDNKASNQKTKPIKTECVWANYEI